MYGDNTDHIGFYADLRGWLPGSLQGQRVVILGAGGVVSSIVQVLIACGAHVVVACRDTMKGRQMLQLVTHNRVHWITLGDLQPGFDGVVHATPMILSEWHCSAIWGIIPRC